MDQKGGLTSEGAIYTLLRTLSSQFLVLPLKWEMDSSAIDLTVSAELHMACPLRKLAWQIRRHTMKGGGHP